MPQALGQTISRECMHCKQYSRIEVSPDQPIICPQCHQKWGEVNAFETIFEHCPLCAGRQFYTDKDFNQVAGCLIMLVGIILVPFTYGISLPVFALVDFLLRKRIISIVVCYRCGAEFRGFKAPAYLKGFMHHIGLKYDKTRDNPFTKP